MQWTACSKRTCGNDGPSPSHRQRKVPLSTPLALADINHPRPMPAPGFGAQSMTTTRSILITVLLAAIVFDRLFWHQGIGINLTLFAVLVLGILLADHGWRHWSTAAKWSAGGAVISAVMVTVHGSIIAIIGAFATLFTCAAFVLSPRVRTTTSALISWAANLFISPIGLVSAVGETLPSTPSIRKGWRWSRITIVPLIVLFAFFQLYRGGNSKFEAMTAGFMDGFGELLSDFFEEVFTPHTLFFLFAIAFAASLLMRSIGGWLADHESTLSDAMRRVRLKRPHWKMPLGMAALDRERRMAVVLLVLVNALLLVVNAIDIHWMWFGFELEPGMSLKEFVHEGTWLLIVSILLSMAILLHQFRGNLNFHPNNRTLLVLASAWLVQNFILGISVFLRNYHYISFHGLAYKRIGVIVFLLLMLVGLVTLYVKIRQRKTFFYLLRMNAWAAFVVLVGLGTIDWDSTIVKFNVAHWNKGEIDVDNYLAMSDKVLPLLYADKDRVREQMSKHMENEVRWVTQLDPEVFNIELDRRRELFMQRYEDQDWQSWTWADERTHRALLDINMAKD